MGLDGVELIMAVEEEFGIAIPDSEAEQCVTVEKLVDIVFPKLRQRGLVTTEFKLEYPFKAPEIKDIIWFVAPLDSRIWTKEDVFLKIREITAEQFGVEESEVTLETDYVRDLGC